MRNVAESIRANTPIFGELTIKTQIAHDAILLSRIISEKQTIKISFIDGEYIADQLKWHTESQLGLKSGKVVNKNAIKYWEILSE